MSFEQIFLIVVFALIFLSSLFFTLLFKNEKEFKNSKWKVFFLVLSSFSIVILSIFYVILLQKEDLNSKLHLKEQLFHIKETSSWEYNKNLLDQASKIPNFISSVLPEVNKLEGSLEEKLNELILSESIFNFWEDYIYYEIISPIKNEEKIPYIATFLNQARSEKLRKIWEIVKFKYNERTKLLTHLLFKYIPEKITPEELTYKAKKLIIDPEFKNIFK